MTFDFDLPANLIATHPAKERSDSRMLVYERASQKITHAHVKDLPAWLVSGDMLVMNEAKVDEVRIPWAWKDQPQEIVLLKCTATSQENSSWEAIVSGKKIPLRTPQPIKGEISFEIAERKEQGIALILLNRSESFVREWIVKNGLLPIPPYIRKQRERMGETQNAEEDEIRYQTVFAQKPGAVAAPTAGLHFTNDLLDSLKYKRVDIEKLYLAVGWGTFEPLTEKHWVTGKLHEEWVEVPQPLARKVKIALEEKRRVIAVGTTTVRSLEWWAQQGASEGGIAGACDIFLRPPWEPEVVSGMLTNFHLPQTSLLTLVGSFLGQRGFEILKNIYQEAIRLEYRFFSYGDCMLIL